MHIGNSRNNISINETAIGIVIILFMTNLNALVDHFLHPEIPYFDAEHLIVGGINLIVSLLLFIMLFTYLKRINRIRKTQKALIAQLQTEKERIKENEINLQQINTTKARLFSIIAHDLKSPFNSILGFSDLLIKNIEKYDTKKKVEFAKQINSSALFAFNLLNNLLIWAKSQTGEIGFDPEKINMLDITNNILKGIDASAKMKNINIVNYIPDKLEVFADSNMLQTILRNLISNAIKFTNIGGEIKIDARPDNDMLKITISDNGIGMDKQSLINLFNQEKHESTSGTASETGSGLGLVLCKEFVEKHKGKIWAESELDKGSKFSFTLPLS